MSSPGWEAVTLQPPAAVRRSVSPSMVHSPVALKRTGKPEDAVAATVNGGSPSVRSDSGAKLMLCEARPIANVRVTDGAGAYAALPP